MKLGKIEKNVSFKRPSARTTSFGFHLMKVGDSKRIDLEKGEVYARVRSAVSTAAAVLGTQLDMKFSVSRDGIGLRVWRTK